MKLWSVIISTLINHLSGLVLCLTTNCLSDNCVHSKYFLINRSKFKQDFTTLIKYLDIKHVLTTIKNPNSNAPVERVHQVTLNMIVTKDLDKKVFDYIYPWGETLASIVWSIRGPYHRTIQDTPGQSVFVQKYAHIELHSSNVAEGSQELFHDVLY